MSKKTLLCSFLCAQIRACVCRHVLTCVAYIHAYASLFLHAFIYSSVYACAGSILHTLQNSTYVGILLRTHGTRQKPQFGHFSSFFIRFSSICNSNIILHHFFTQLYVPCHISSYCESNIIFPPFFSPNHDFNPNLFLQVSVPYSGKGSTSWVLVWYNILIEETRGHIYATGFEHIICLMPERSTSVVLAQALAKRWWDTTHTFHIAGQEMTITPYDFHRVTGLQFDGVLISLEDESGIRLGADLLERRYDIKTICYTDPEANFMDRPQGMPKECIWMAKVFLLFLLGAYLFANGGQTVSLRWLDFFQDFKRA